MERAPWWSLTLLKEVGQALAPYPLELNQKYPLKMGELNSCCKPSMTYLRIVCRRSHKLPYLSAS